MKELIKSVFRKQPQKKGTGYTAAYLKKKELKTRQCVYISKEMHGIVSRITRMFPDREVTVGSYVDNVLTQHFEAHKNEINELYRKELEEKNGKPLIV
jgi:hypothetical protein